MEKMEEMELIPRDFLARQRTSLANERTLLAYIRTSLYFLVSGTALFEVKELEAIRHLGYFGFALSVGFLGIGILHFIQVRRKLRKGNYTSM